MTPSVSTSNGGFLGQLLAWFAHPFNSTGSAFNWILFVGLLIVAIWFWQVILIDVTRGMEAV